MSALADAPATDLAAQPPDPVPFAQPRPAGALGWIGVVLALVVLGVAVVLVHDGLVALDVLGGDTWLLAAADAVGRITPTWQVALVGAVVALVGLRLLVVALRPRRRPAIPLAAGGGQYLLGQDVARLASGAAAQVDGVFDVRSTWGRRAVTVDATTDGDTTVTDQVRSAVAERLTALADVPRVAVRARRASRTDGRGGVR
ncbi:DUF6286 domain-containing protein [Cellulomonas wangsupingiae]|uniref:Alkaline shock response membrane anchor protein AmaP n=1 Tax=Cellulomonas wangsupingiae TaxID=2968085 RepID=A0ABY5K8D5_9CELL|nr:DUF6286 domain-containing protein [Cellulomonas wangsupingiae]MCC2334892.1 alkaline shock response membrane anchor protein AmaP [Cellulomonas wangsupingiae]UUI65392.1 alkaline shock response membrane anchor protein AmaP [Cellulomonas wangsupingiae]